MIHHVEVIQVESRLQVEIVQVREDAVFNPAFFTRL
jgi:hypothetical protein